MGDRAILPLLFAVGALSNVTDSWWVGVGHPFLPGLNVCAVMSVFRLPYLTYINVNLFFKKATQSMPCI